MLGRQFVHVAGRCRVGHVEARLRECVRRPDVGERSATAVRHPDAWILRTPAARREGRASTAGGVEGRSDRGRQIRAAAAMDLHVVHERTLARHPENARRPRIDAAGVDADPAHDVGAAAWRLEHRLRRADTLVAGCGVREIELGRAGMERNQDRVRLQHDRTAHDVEAAREIQHPMGIDRLLDGARVVGLSVALYTKGVDVHPAIGGRKRRDGRRQLVRQRAQRCGRIERVQVSDRACASDHETVVEVLDAIHPSSTRLRLSTLAKSRKRRHVRTEGVLEAHLGRGVVLVADDHDRFGDVLEPAVLHPQLIRIVRIDVDRHGHVTERVPDEREAGHVLANRGVALAVEHRVQQRELPERRRVVGEDAVTAAVEMQVFRFVADLGERGEARADVEIHVTQVAVLGDMETDRDGGRVAVADLEVDIAHGRIERARSGVGNGVVRGNAAGRRKRHSGVARWRTSTRSAG